MTKWLASVQSLEEAKIISHVLPDILDMKNPHEGALGGLPLATVSEIADWVNGRCMTSATIGDLPMQIEVLAPAMQAMAQTGVDYIKVGLFVEHALDQCLADLKTVIPSLDKPVIAVLFADQLTDLTRLPAIHAAGFAGVMVDTAYKNGQGLRCHWSREMLAEFIDAAKGLGLICGLAGALALEDIPQLEVFGADYLGFRSALCDAQQRQLSLSAECAAAIHQACYQLGLAS